MSEYLEKLRSIGVSRRAGTSRTTAERHGKVVMRTTEHWDGRQDVAVTPDTARFQAVRHKTGKKKGQVAEIKGKT